MTHADSLHYQPSQGCGNFIYKILVLGHQKAQVEPIHVWNIDKDFMVHELTPVLHRRSTRSMASSISVRAEDRLEGVGNFNVWKLRITNILQEHDLDQYVTTVMEEPTTNAGREALRKSQAKAKRIIFDSVKDSIMPTMTSLLTAKDCMDTLVNLYEKQAPSQKGTLKHKLKYLKMDKSESIASFCSRIAQIRDQLLVTGVTVDDDDLV
jgi:hypothetical protein